MMSNLIILFQYIKTLLRPGKTRITRLLVCDGNIMDEDQTMDGMAIKIDLRKFLKRS